MNMDHENGCSVMEYRPTLRERFADWLIKQREPSEDFRNICPPDGGDVLYSHTHIQFDWPGILRLILLGRRCQVEVRTRTTEPVNSLESLTHVHIG